jgi:membrane-bound serine protease (ClpP class)
MDPIVWAMLLLAAGMALAVLEMFLPSGGIIGLLSIAALGGAVWMGFQHGSWTGLGVIAVVVIGLPMMLSVAVRIWPETSMGRRLLLDTPKAEEILPDSDARRSLKALVGRVGVAKTLMMPSGAVQVDGHVIDAVSEGVVIEPGQAIRVVEVRGSRVVVRPSSQSPSPIDPSDPLSQPIESLGIDPFADEPTT